MWQGKWQVHSLNSCNILDHHSAIEGDKALQSKQRLCNSPLIKGFLYLPTYFDDISVDSNDNLWRTFNSPQLQRMIQSNMMIKNRFIT